MRRSAVPLFVLLAGLSGCRDKPAAEDYGPVGDFALTECHEGKTVSQSDLRGKVWVASFVFTRCTGPCPQVTATVARLQSELRNEPDLRYVTFTVDPDHDDPQELKRYAEHFRADPARWLFLTGERDAVYRLLRDGFHVGVEQNRGSERTPGNEVTHSSRLVVVDRRGHVRGYFQGVRDPIDPDGERAFEDGLRRLRTLVAALLREAP